MGKPVCVVVGVGPKNGQAFALRFANEGYAVALLSRSTGYSSGIAEEIGGRAYACDVTDPAAIKSAFAKVRHDFGDVDVLLYNVGTGQFGRFDDVPDKDFEKGWQVNVRGLLQSTREVVGPMRERASGAIIVTGATASLRGKPFTPAFASAKAAQRSLAQSLARQLGPEGIHVALVIDQGSGQVRRIVWVGLGLASLQQLVGINVVFYYGAVLWQSVGFKESDALLINLVSGGLSIGAVTVTILLIDRIGRKPILMVGSIGMAITLALVSYAFANATAAADGSLTLEGFYGPLALIAANTYVVFFNFSWGPVMWVMLGEMFPNQIRGSGLAVAGFFQWVSNFAITMTFPIMLGSIGLAAAYGFYTLCAAISIVFVLKYVHETKGKELEQMEG